MARERRSKYGNDAKDTAQLASQLAQKAAKTDLDTTKSNLELMQNNVFEANTKFTRVSNPFKDTTQTQDPLDMIVWKNTTNGNVRMITKWNDTEDIMFEIRQPTPNPNQTFSPFGSVQTKDNTGEKPTAWSGAIKTVPYSASTDWLGPMIMKAVNNGDGSISHNFTGGFHGHTGGLTGNPTAQNISHKTLVDGVDVTGSAVVLNQNCKKIEFIAKNRVMAYNTVSLGRYVLEETHHMILKGRKGEVMVEVFTELKALEDLEIEKYYGLQTHSPTSPANIWAETVHFVNGQQKARVNFNADMNSGLKGSFITTRVSERGTLGELVSWIDQSYGLGTMEYCDINQPCVFVINNTKKLYYNLVSNKTLSLKAGAKAFWHGGWSMIYGSTDDGVADLNTTKLENDKFVKVIDFTKAGNAEVPMTGDYAGNVINLTGGIGYSKFLYDGILRITSPSYGSIEILE